MSSPSFAKMPNKKTGSSSSPTSISKTPHFSPIDTKNSTSTSSPKPIQVPLFNPVKSAVRPTTPNGEPNSTTTYSTPPVAYQPTPPAGVEAFRDEYGFRYDGQGNRLDRNGNIISPQSTVR